MSKRQSFSREFKLEAVRLLQLGEKPAADLARELGIPRNRLYKWRDEVNKKATEKRSEPFYLLLLGRIDRQLSRESPLVGGPRFTTGHIGGEDREFVQDAR